MQSTNYLISLTLLCLVTFGCGDEKASHPASPAASPRAIIEQLLNASIAVDEDAVLACFTGTDKEINAIRKAVDFARATTAFKNKFIATYGQEAWDDFQDPDKASDDGNATFMFVTDEHLEELDDYEIIDKGGTAIVPLPNEDRGAEAIKTAEGWLITAKSFLPPGQPEGIGEFLAAMTSTTRKFMKAIGHEGITPQDIDAELGKALMVHFGFAIETNKRFNIDEI